MSLLQVAVVKQIQGNAIAFDKDANARELKVGDVLSLGEGLKTDGENSNITLALSNGKEIKLLGNDKIVLDQSVGVNESFENEAIADISTIQQAILNGEDLNQLEETAAGGTGGDGAGGTAQINSGSFIDGGHYSNVTANVSEYGNTFQTNYTPGATSVAGGGSQEAQEASVTPTMPVAPVAPTYKILNVDMEAKPAFAFSQADIEAKVDARVADIRVNPSNYTTVDMRSDSVNYKDLNNNKNNVVLMGDNSHDTVEFRQVGGNNTVIFGDHSASVKLDGEGDNIIDARGNSSWSQVTIIDQIYDGVVTGNNTIITGKGGDNILLDSATGDNLIMTGEGDDHVSFWDFHAGSRATIYAGDGNDTISAFSYDTKNDQNIEIDGGKGNDSISIGNKSGVNNKYVVYGGEGDDSINVEVSALKDATIDGGDGKDTLWIRTYADDVSETIDFRNLANGELDKKISNIEEIRLLTSKSDIVIKNINPQDILDITDDKNTILKFSGSSSSSISLNDFREASDQSEVKPGYKRYESEVVRVKDNDTGELSEPMTVKIDIQDNIHVDL